MDNKKYPTENKLLQNLTAELEEKLGHNLIGIYLYGSLATGDFVDKLSDIDLLIIIKDEINQEQLKMLSSLHAKFNASHRGWSKRIDVAYLSTNDLETFESKSSKAIVSDGDGGLEIVDTPEYYLIDWYKVQEHALDLYGPTVTTFMPHITSEKFTRAIYNYMLTWPERATTATKRGDQAYAVLTTCRSHYACTQAHHISKKAGALWVIGKYPQWSNLIERSLRWSRDENNSDVIDKQNQLETQEFIEFILNKTTKNRAS